MIQVNKESFIQPNLAPLSFLQATDWRDILIVTRNGEFKVRVTGNDFLKATAEYNDEDFKDIYIGGAPQALRERYVVNNFPLKYCVLCMRQSAFSHCSENNVIFCSSSQT